MTDKPEPTSPLSHIVPPPPPAKGPSEQNIPRPAPEGSWPPPVS